MKLFEKEMSRVGTNRPQTQARVPKFLIFLKECEAFIFRQSMFINPKASGDIEDLTSGVFSDDGTR